MEVDQVHDKVPFPEFAALCHQPCGEILGHAFPGKPPACRILQPAPVVRVHEVPEVDLHELVDRVPGHFSRSSVHEPEPVVLVDVDGIAAVLDYEPVFLLVLLQGLLGPLPLGDVGEEYHDGRAPVPRDEDPAGLNPADAPVLSAEPEGVPRVGLAPEPAPVLLHDHGPVVLVDHGADGDGREFLLLVPEEFCELRVCHPEVAVLDHADRLRRVPDKVPVMLLALF